MRCIRETQVLYTEEAITNRPQTAFTEYTVCPSIYIDTKTICRITFFQKIFFDFARRIFRNVSDGISGDRRNAARMAAAD